MKYGLHIILLMMLPAYFVHGQNYNAIHGSNYSGALGVYNNPASILTSPYKWDVTLAGYQFMTISNVVKGPNFPFSLFPKATFYIANGNFKRYADGTTDLHLLNSRYAINSNNAIAFGLNFRGNTQGQSTPIHYTDSVRGPRSFLFLNERNESIELDAASSGWLEFYGSYARTIINSETRRLNGGVTMKLMRSMSGAFASARDVKVVSDQENDQVIYKITNGDVKYGYSANHGNGTSFSTADFFENSKTGFAIDIGAEYLVKSQAVPSIYDEVSENDYDWKIGFSLLDLGWNTYDYSNLSRAASSLKEDVSSLVLQEKFSTVTDVSSFNDSVATIVNSFSPLSGTFKVKNPMRAVINIDRYISGNIYINGELTINFTSQGPANYAVKEPKLLAITPRWESSKWGFFMPVQVTRHGNFWIGGAVKAGPLLFGTHNLLNIFSKNKYLASGAYLALTLRPFEISGANGNRNRNRQYECPEY